MFGLAALHRIERGRAAADVRPASDAYLTAAQRIAAAALIAFADSAGVVREPCEGTGSCGCDGIEFRGPFVRGLAALHTVAPDASIADLLNRTLTAALEHDSNAEWQFGLHWNGPNNTMLTTLTQIPVLDLFVSAYAVQFPKESV